jgi:hypothetical protein
MKTILPHERKIAVERILDSVWTVEFFEVADGEVYITNYSRRDERGYEQENEVPVSRLVEDEHRNVTHLMLWPPSTPSHEQGRRKPKRFDVVNVKNVFSYKENEQ